MREAVLVSGVRTAVGRAGKGSLKNARPEDLGGLVAREALNRAKGLSEEDIEDVIIGCAMPEGEQGSNLGRIVAARAGFPYSVPGFTINRFCASGLQSIALAAERIMSGFADVIIAGGVESMSKIPMEGYRPLPNPYLVEHQPDLYMSMGHTAENVAERYGVNRAEQDAFAVESHRKAAAAIANGRFRDEIVPVQVSETYLDESERPQTRTLIFDTDEGVRPETNQEILSTLRPAFKRNGSVTAGNSSQRSDGAAAVVVMERKKAESMGLKPLAIFRSFALGGVDPDVMGIGPVVAIPKALKMAGVDRDQIDLFEINEAFASQCRYIIRHLELDEKKANVNGGAIALGHPLGCTGSKLTVSLMYEAQRRKSKFGVVSMCIGGGMGAAAVFEFLP